MEESVLCVKIILLLFPDTSPNVIKSTSVVLALGILGASTPPITVMKLFPETGLLIKIGSPKLIEVILILLLTDKLAEAVTGSAAFIFETRASIDDVVVAANETFVNTPLTDNLKP